MTDRWLARACLAGLIGMTFGYIAAAVLEKLGG